MSLKYAAFNGAIKLKAPFSRNRRKSRMKLFLERMKIRGGERIIDLGGVAAFWNDCHLPLNITVVNLPGSGLRQGAGSIHNMTFVEGDACNIPFVSDNSFDIAFSNSVIEHVGPADNQRAFAREVNRIAPRFWVQTPSIWFPIEAHNHMPFWWAYPAPLKDWFIGRWRCKLPAWTEMIEHTTVIKRGELQEMFPKGTIWTEYFGGFPKSYVTYRQDI